VTEGDFPLEADLDSQLLFVCRYGLLAPSVHNTQPWKVLVREGKISIYADQSRVLTHGDPTGRETWLTLGCFAESITLTAHELGLVQTDAEFSFGSLDDRIAQLSFRPSSNQVKDSMVLRAIAERHSDRGIFEVREIEKSILLALEKCWHDAGVKIVVTSEKSLISKVAELTSRGIAMALSSPSFGKELGELVLPNWSRQKYGMPGYVLNTSTTRSMYEGALIKNGLVTKRQAKKEFDAMNSSAALLFVLSEGDTREYWFKSGRALMRASVESTIHGLSHSFTAAVVEAADFHTDIENALDSKYRLQAVLRLGFSRARPRHSPRFGLDDILLH
jgi:hypothetical protein